jgi:ComF family protein
MWNIASASPLALLGRAARTALDLVYPPSCLACRRAIVEHGALCGQCWSAMRFIERPFCDRLGTPFEQDLGPGLLSPQAVADPPVFGRARAVARFEDGPARRLVHRLKYSDREELARPLGAWMARAGAEILAGADVLAPVPLHPLRLWSRRFNQAAALGHAVARHAGIPCETGLLARVKATRSQVGMTRLQRAVRAPADAALKGRRVVLVDDVLTSGATANAASRALLRGGASSVDVLVFARVVTDA